MYDIARERAYPTPIANSTLLPLMLMSLATQQNAPNITQTTSRIYSEYDYIIVGAGSAGSTLAARLTEIPCVKVLLLEAGRGAPLLSDIPGYQKFFYGTDVFWKYKTVPQKRGATQLKNRILHYSIGKGFGGSSAFNDNVYARGNHKNFNDWAKQGALGWSYDDVLQYFKKMEDNKNKQLVKNGYHGVGGPVTVEDVNYNPELKTRLIEAATEFGYDFVDSNAARQTGFFSFQGTLRNAQRCSTAKAYLVPAQNRSNLHMLPYAFTHKVIIEGNRTVGVSFEVNGTIHKVKAKREVILSAGTINTAKLLMLSGIGPKEELEKHDIPLVADLPVGKNFHDHQSIPINFELDSRYPSTTQLLSSENNMMDYIDNRRGPLASLNLLAIYAYVRGTTVRPKVDNPNCMLFFAKNNPKAASRGLIESAAKQYFGPYLDKPIYQCIVTIIQPKSRGTVQLNSSDPYDPPVIDPNIYADERDLADMVSGIKVCLKFGASNAMKKMGSKLFNTTYPICEKYLNDEEKHLECIAKTVNEVYYHQVGTAKMGDAKDPSTVVNPQLKVKNIEGLRVVDASVMPIVPSGNTNTPTIMVAEKAADIIKQTIQCL